MKLVPVIVSIILASSALGFESALGVASSGMASPGQSTPCTASHPCAKICGDHPCAPGEVYVPSSTATKANATTTNDTNGTAPPMSTQMNISENVTATKITNGTSMTGEMANGTMKVMTGNMNGTMKGMMGTTNTVPPPAPILPPEKQVLSGVIPADVKCPSGYKLALNKFDQRPACVTSDNLAKLVARGWTAA